MYDQVQPMTFGYIIRRSPDRRFHHWSGAINRDRRSTSTSRKHVESCVSRGRDPFHESVPFKGDQQLREKLEVEGVGQSFKECWWWGHVLM